MSKTEDLLSQAQKEILPTAGEIALALATRRGLTRAKIDGWAASLRRTADTLEEILK